MNRDNVVPVGRIFERRLKVYTFFLTPELNSVFQQLLIKIESNVKFSRKLLIEDVITHLSASCAPLTWLEYASSRSA